MRSVRTGEQADDVSVPVYDMRHLQTAVEYNLQLMHLQTSH